MNYRSVVRVLVSNGFAFDRQRGSHRIYKGVVAGKVRVVVVAYHRESDEIRPGVLAAMIRQSGLNKKLFG